MGSLTEARERMEKKGTVGKFTAMAKRAGKPTQEFAKEKLHSKNPKVAKEANFARMAGRGFKPLSKH